MTLVISAVSNKGLYQVSDRRLMNWSGTTTLTDDATKTVRLDLQDGKALVSYAGIGRVRDLQISEWLKRILRGQKLKYLEFRNLLAEKATQKITPLEATLHEFVIVANVEGKPRFEVISSDRTGNYYNSGSARNGVFGTFAPPRIRSSVYFSGSGRDALSRQDKRVAVQAIKRRNLTSQQFEAVLVHLHLTAWKQQRNGSVSRDCICTHVDSQGGGWSHLHTSNGTSVYNLPSIMGGLPADDISKAIMKIVGPELSAAVREGRTPRSTIAEVQDALKGIELTPEDSL
ncbi:hypothetical protein [Candidatus Nitronereus thalassa]|uniref:Uncharacterized protein n=1 Tax=Candidatus Nitronereus thalassa TaxID=3020898 RepID=A0ABU3K9M0_9BACT|nr:hypothetical protein [Candidatus Nitronereus thalassa]MDT7043107.1 hypothetical protein [Candidatus Nitronereus thalassa]